MKPSDLEEIRHAMNRLRAKASEGVTMPTSTVMNETAIVMDAVYRAERTAAPDSAAEPVGWVFELARSLDQTTGEYCNWGPPQFSFTEPCVSENAIRNLRPVYYGS